METPLLRIAPRLADIGGISVARLLPTRQRRMIGAWCFLDHAGPARFTAGGGMHVGAHPHTCLQTFTWMIAGEVVHRDSLGNEQRIRPGQINLMTAGHGISHTEDSAPGEEELHAAQLWIALPPALADCPPAFEHYPQLPVWSRQGCRLSLLVGSLEGYQSPVQVATPLFGLEAHAPAAAALELPLRPDHEYGLLVLEGRVALGGEHFAQDELALLPAGAATLQVQLEAGARVLLLGGEPFGGEVLMWWNFVGHSREEIIRAQHAWEAGSPRFGQVAGGVRLQAPPLPWGR